MAGITYLYGLWNINMLGDSTVAPSLMEAHMDIQACLSVLEALSGESMWISGPFRFLLSTRFLSYSDRAFSQSLSMDF
jgi:hypothetical protein